MEDPEQSTWCPAIPAWSGIEGLIRTCLGVRLYDDELPRPPPQMAYFPGEQKLHIGELGAPGLLA